MDYTCPTRGTEQEQQPVKRAKRQYGAANVPLNSQRYLAQILVLTAGWVQKANRQCRCNTE